MTIKESAYFEFGKVNDFFQWIRESQDNDKTRKRIAVWLAIECQVKAELISNILGVSKQSVWLWVRQYKKWGADCFERHPHGGRRWAYIPNLEVEGEALYEVARRINRRGEYITANILKEEMIIMLGKNITTGYIYKLMKRTRMDLNFLRTIKQ